MPLLHTQDGVALYYNDEGQGRPVVLIHGWPLSSESWRDLSDQLVKQGFRVLSYDRRGYGHSDQPGDGYDYQTLSDDLRQLIEQLGLQDAVLVGYSMGTGEVARYLGRFGTERVAGAVLLAGITPQLARSDANPEGLDRAVFDEFIGDLSRDRVGFLENYARACFPDAAMQQWYLGMASRASTRAIIASAEAWYATDFRADLKSIRVPTLIIHGDSDQSAPVETTGRVAAGIVPQVHYIEYPGAGHYFPFEQKQQLMQDLLLFLHALPEPSLLLNQPAQPLVEHPPQPAPSY